MNLTKLTENKLLLVAVGLIGVYVLSRVAGKKIGDTAHAVVQSVNPTNENNLIYKALNSVGDVIDDGEDDDSFDLGRWIYDATHDDVFDNVYGGD